MSKNSKRCYKGIFAAIIVSIVNYNAVHFERVKGLSHRNKQNINTFIATSKNTRH